MIKRRKIAIGIIFTFIGAAIGTASVLALDPSFLNFLIPVLLIFIFIYTIFSPKLGDTSRKAVMKENVFYTLFGFILGFYDGFFGPGTGSFWIFVIMALIG